MDKKGILTVWFKGLEEKDKTKLEDLLRHNTFLLSRLLSVLDEWEKEIENRETSTSDYDSPSWAYKQAHYNGQKSTLSKIKRLFDF